MADPKVTFLIMAFVKSADSISLLLSIAPVKFESQKLTSLKTPEIFALVKFCPSKLHSVKVDKLTPARSLFL